MDCKEEEKRRGGEVGGEGKEGGGSRRRKDIGSHKYMLRKDIESHKYMLFSPQSLSHYRTKRGHDFSSVACTPRHWPATAAADGGEGGGGADRPGA